MNLNQTETFLSQSTCLSSLIIHQTSKPETNLVKNRLVQLSPTVSACLERECTSGDFIHDTGNSIGKGSFSSVYKVTHRQTGKTYAIKVIDKTKLINSNQTHLIAREISIMYTLNHRHIIKLINHFEDDVNIYLILPVAVKGNLYSHLKKAGRFDERTASKFVFETIEAVKYLHSQSPRIVHRDIKSENLLLDDHFNVILTDFGIANYEDNQGLLKTMCGSSEYMAPEVLKGKSYDYRVDIWGIGILLFELLAGYTPFKASSQEEQILNIKRLKINWPNDFPPMAKNLICKILKLDPSERASLEEIMSHSWFEKNASFRVKEVGEKDKEDNKGINLEDHLIMRDREDKIINRIDNNITCKPPISNDKQYKTIIKELKDEIKELKLQKEKLENDHENENKKNNEIITNFYERIKEKNKYINEIEEKLKDYEQKISVNEKENFDKDIKINSLKSMYSTVEKEKEEYIKELTALKEILQNKEKTYSDEINRLKSLIKISEISENKNENNKDLSITKSFKVITEILREIKKTFQIYFDKIENQLYEIKQNQNKQIEQSNEILVQHATQFNDTLYKLNSSLKSTIEKSSNKFSNLNTKVVNYLNDKVKQLQEENNLLKQTKNEVDSLKEQIQLLEETKQIQKKELLTNNNLINLYSERDEKSKKKYFDLKYQIQLLHNFVEELGPHENANNELLKYIKDILSKY